MIRTELQVGPGTMTAQARARGVSTKIRRHRIAGLGSLRMTCHTMMLIDEILRAGETANESVLSRSGLKILKTVGLLTLKTNDTGWNERNSMSLPG